MTSDSEYGTDEFAEEFEGLVASERDHQNLLERGQAVLTKLLPNKELAKGVLAQLLSSESLPYHMLSTTDNHDFLLHRSPKGSFSLRLYVWEPGSHHHIHDHGSWGVVGAYVNELLVIRYRRVDDGTNEGYAKLVSQERRILQEGQTSSVLPFDDGIHWTGSSGYHLAMSIHAYGRALRRGYILGFDLDKDSTYKLCTPRLEKSLLAAKALGVLGGKSAKAALEGGLESRYPLVRWEALMALERIDPELANTLIEKAVHDESEEVRARARVHLESLG